MWLMENLIIDCCDGSDEYEGKVKCTNDCEAKGAEMRKQQEEEKAKIEKVFIILLLIDSFIIYFIYLFTYTVT